MPNLTPQLCIDPVTGTEVLYAPLRATRSNAFASEPLLLPSGEMCPFCPGNEHETPPEVYRWPAVEQDPRWQIRVVPNRFPAVATDEETKSEHESRLGRSLALPQSPAHGKHEVLIESDQHDADWLSMSPEHLARILTVIGLRIAAWRSDPRIVYAQVFKNVGSRAGASLAHPHLQLVGLSFVPRQIKQMVMRSEEYRREHGCGYQQILWQRHPELIVHQDDGLLTLCPPVSRVPYELWIVPTEEIPYDQLPTLKLAQSVLSKQKQTVGEVAHNIVWHLPPFGADPTNWRLEIIPRLTTFAGLELGAGVYINPVRPETAVERLRGDV
jgi:UDPglucose--hexose-1-phosphate uridylyltransferase